jgi:6-phosphogluconolactonase
MDATRTIRIVPDTDALASEAASLVVQHARAAVAARGRFMLALSGGATPRATYARLASLPEPDEMPWARTWIFFGDERCVPAGHHESNYHMASETLLSKVPIPASQVFPMRGHSDDTDAAATEYARTLATVFGTRRGALPRFDVILLGFGVDGHTASLFPGSPVLKEVFRPVAAVHAAAATIPERITLTFPVINAAACVIFLGSGTEKAKVVRAMLAERTALPASMVEPTDGTLLWILDRAAAAFLPPDTKP